jgi:hypothetical protein
MIRLHEKCIFCYAMLPHPDLRKGEGEHIIPKNILGIWQSSDICVDCKQYFGDNVDNIPLYNTPMIDAVHALELENKERFKEQVRYKAKDKFTNAELSMYRRNEKMKIHVHENDLTINCPDENIMNVGLSKVKKYYKDRYDEKLIEEEFIKLYKQYQTAEDNSLISSNKIPLTLRKGKISNIEVDKTSLRDMSPLIAKIAVFFLNYTFSYDELRKIKNYLLVRDHAILNKPLPEYTINWNPHRKGKVYEKKHLLLLENTERIGFLNISLLGYPNWKVILNYQEILPIYNELGQELDVWGFAFDYDDKTKFIANRVKGEIEIKFIPVDF